MEQGELIIPGQEPVLAPGVRGYTIEKDGELYVPLIIAENPGGGDVAAYLNSLPTDRTVKFPTVLNQRLEEMLQRRGFVLQIEHDSSWGKVEVWTRKAAAS